MAVRRPTRANGQGGALSRPLVTPLNMSVVYATDGPDKLDAIYDEGAPGYTYAREGHPNASALAAHLDQLEGVQGGMVVGSGMAAVSTVLLGLTQTGDHVLGGDQLYGRSLRMMAEDLPRLGIETSLADPTDVDAMRAAIRPNTRIILVEIISNPTLRVADIDGLAALAKEVGALLVVDNTFATPLGFRPLDHGADIVLHSVTKLLAGHSDVTLGYVAARESSLNEKMMVFCATTGLTPSPFDCWLAERGLLSFHLRHERAVENARKLADHLAGVPGVERVIYPTRTDHPDHALAMGQLAGQGGNMVSFEIGGGRPAATRLVEALPDLAFAPTLGDVATILSHPPSSSHRAMPEAERLANGISEGFFRISVGVEPVEALCQEFELAIKAATA